LMVSNDLKEFALQLEGQVEPNELAE